VVKKSNPVKSRSTWILYAGHIWYLAKIQYPFIPNDKKHSWLVGDSIKQL